MNRVPKNVERAQRTVNAAIAILDLETRWAILDDKKGKFRGAVDLKRELEAATSDYLRHHADFAK
jgi:hypothetical protein